MPFTFVILYLVVIYHIVISFRLRTGITGLLAAGLLGLRDKGQSLWHKGLRRASRWLSSAPLGRRSLASLQFYCRFLGRIDQLYPPCLPPL